MSVIGRRLEPPEDVELKLGDMVTYEVIFNDGSKGTISTKVEEFDLNCRSTGEVIKWEWAIVAHFFCL